MTVQDRLAQLDWKAIEASLWQLGYAKIDSLLASEECDALVALYSKDQLFRSRIDMKRFRFGEGEYKYFTYPLPPLVQALRETIYPHLAAVANAWAKALGQPDIYPLSHDQLLAIFPVVSFCSWSSDHGHNHAVRCWLPSREAS